MSDEGQSQVTTEQELDAAEKRRIAARRRFLKGGSAAGSGLVILTISHQRSFASGTAQEVYVSSVAACSSIGGSNAKLTTVVDSVNPVIKKDGSGQPVKDQNGNWVYVESKEAYQCTVIK